MLYYNCPHCGASIYVVVKWDSVICPFCRGEIIFPGMVVIDTEKLKYWGRLYQIADKNKEKP
ncbi:MAG: hypothetical protein RSB05_03170 [Clostridiales bacterium]